VKSKERAEKVKWRWRGYNRNAHRHGSAKRASDAATLADEAAAQRKTEKAGGGRENDAGIFAAAACWRREV